MNEKVKSQKQIFRIARNLKRQKRKTVVANGSFDLLHAGHVQALQEAKMQGDTLIVLVNSDHSVRNYKGRGRPVIPEGERAAMLAALACVDYVVLFDDMNPTRLFEELRPDVLVSGKEWGAGCIGADSIARYGGRVHVLKQYKGLSTTDLLKRIVTADSRPAPRAVFLDRDGTLNRNGKGYTYRRADFRFVPGAISALRRLSKTGYKIIIVTNQSGVGRGYFKKSDVEKLHRWLRRYAEKHGARIDAIYYCPHRPEASCACRKPKPGLILKAAKDFGLDLSKSWFIGDDERDVLAGRWSNVKVIKVGKPVGEKMKLRAQHYVKNLQEALRHILAH